jgi:PPK2 family polyphosphate:nucleotide phosphotransferase
MKAPSKVSSPYRIHPHSHVDLKKISTSDTGHYKSEDSAKHDTQKNLLKLAAQQELLAANATKGLLIVLQAMDAGGKDGTISHIFTGVNPQGCEVAQFKVPTPLEASHDFLWRVHKRVPAKGKIGIFNRSHYEDVLITRVHGSIDKKEVQRRYQEIVDFEKMLAENGTVILKFFLHISHKEQTARLKERMADPDKHWKLSESDFRERRFWKQYQGAYEEAIEATSRAHAPWFVVPADYKWYRNVVISKILVETMQAMKLSYPKPGIDFSKYQL